MNRIRNERGTIEGLMAAFINLSVSMSSFAVLIQEDFRTDYEMNLNLSESEESSECNFASGLNQNENQINFRITKTQKRQKAQQISFFQL